MQCMRLKLVRRGMIGTVVLHSIFQESGGAIAPLAPPVPTPMIVQAQKVVYYYLNFHRTVTFECFESYYLLIQRAASL